MCKDLHDTFPYVKELIQECDDIVGYSLSNLMFNGPLPDLTQTISAQPAVLIHSLSMLKVLQNEMGLFLPNSGDFSVAMGLSLGEYSALTASQCLASERDAIYLVDQRARAMQQCCAVPEDENLAQKMLAIMHDGSLTEDALQSLIDGLDIMQSAEYGPLVADIANLNSPRQVVVSGHLAALDALKDALKAKRIKSKYINTGGAFHSSLMTEAKLKLDAVLQDMTVTLPAKGHTVISNVEATIVSDDGEDNPIKSLLCNQVCSAVRWYPSVLKCVQELGVSEFVEIGPKATISGMVRDICKINDIEGIEVSNFDTLDNVKSIQANSK